MAEAKVTAKVAAEVTAEAKATAQRTVALVEVLLVIIKRGPIALLQVAHRFLQRLA